MLIEAEKDTMIGKFKETGQEVHIEIGHMSTIDQEITRDLETETEHQGKDQGQEIGIEGQGHVRVGITKKMTDLDLADERFFRYFF